MQVVPDWLYRGYTGHEHLAEFGLINMNARLYDPVLGRMLSPDNYVNDYFGSQAFNRYSYANNNPLKYTDPSGNIIPILVVAGEILLKSVVQGAISVGVNGALNWAQGKPFFEGGGKAFVSGALGGAIGGTFEKAFKVTSALGQAFNNAATGFLSYVGTTAIFNEQPSMGGAFGSIVSAVATPYIMKGMGNAGRWVWAKVNPKVSKPLNWISTKFDKVAEKFKGWINPNRSTTGLKNVAPFEFDLIQDGIVDDVQAAGWRWNGQQFAPSGELSKTLLGLPTGYFRFSKFDQHFSKHAQEWGAISKDSYYKRALSLMDGNTDGNDSKIVRKGEEKTSDLRIQKTYAI